MSKQQIAEAQVLSTKRYVSNWEVKSSYTATVTASDGSNAAIQGTTVNVTNMNNN